MPFCSRICRTTEPAASSISIARAEGSAVTASARLGLGGGRRQMGRPPAAHTRRVRATRDHPRNRREVTPDGKSRRRSSSRAGAQAAPGEMQWQRAHTRPSRRVRVAQLAVQGGGRRRHRSHQSARGLSRVTVHPAAWVLTQPVPGARGWEWLHRRTQKKREKKQILLLLIVTYKDREAHSEQCYVVCNPLLTCSFS